MDANYAPLEEYFRGIPMIQEDVTLTFEIVEKILGESLPSAAYEQYDWWGNQKQGTHVEAIAWMNAGWMMETVNLNERWVRFVRQ